MSFSPSVPDLDFLEIEHIPPQRLAITAGTNIVCRIASAHVVPCTTIDYL